jgi:hypothetical protein
MAFFSVVFAAVRAQPGAADLQAFLRSDGCAMPCWQHIQPGITTVDQALALLRANPWIRRALAGGTSADTRIYWQWSEQAPTFAGTMTALYPDSYLHARNGIISYIRLTTHIRYGNVRLVMGAPETGSFQPTTPSSFNRQYFHTAGYFEGRVAIDTNLVCPATPLEFWNDPVVVIYNDGTYNAYNAMPNYNLIPWIYESNCIT